MTGPNAEYAGPLCGDETCELCPTQADLDAFYQRQQDDARAIVRYMLGLHQGAQSDRKESNG